MPAVEPDEARAGQRAHAVELAAAVGEQGLRDGGGVCSCNAQLARTDATFARLGIGDVAERLDEQAPDALEELWALDCDAPLDAYLDRRA